MLTIRQAAIRLNLPERAIRAWIKKGVIPVTYSGNRAYISDEWIRKKLEQDGKIG